MTTMELDDLVRSIGIPPQPALLAHLQAEMARPEPDLRRIANLVSADVAMTASVIRVVNSPAYASSRSIESVDQAISMLGMRQVAALVTGLVVRNVLRADGPQLTRFWDASSKRAYAMSRLARGMQGVEVGTAQTFGLMCDVGIPLLMQRFPDYGRTLKACNEEATRPFTDVERDLHGTDHAFIGGLMARTWGLSDVVVTAIRRHHDYSIFQEADASPVVIRIVAMGLVAERAIQRFAGMNHSHEWTKGGESAMGALVISDSGLEDWMDELNDSFASGMA